MIERHIKFWYDLLKEQIEWCSLKNYHDQPPDCKHPLITDKYTQTGDHAQTNG